MASSSATTVPLDRLEVLERELARARRWIVISFLLNLLIVAVGLHYFGLLANKTIELQKILLTDPAHHVRGIIAMDNNWDGLQSKDYHPGIEFLDEKGDKKMGLFSTGVHFGQEKQWANLSFLGLDIGDQEKDKNTAIWLTGDMFSYTNNQGQFQVFSHLTAWISP